MNEFEGMKPTKGTWKTLGENRGIKFELGKPEQVTFTTDEPEEKKSTFGENDVYYSFPVKKIDGTDSAVETSAWTLLFELKKLAPLKDKTVQITKRMDKGKQSYVVVPIV